METLGDIAGDRIAVECLSCRRRGVYAMLGLLERFGHSMSQLDVLRHLSASCRHQRQPGSPPVRKYEAGCQARLILPRPPMRIVPTAMQRPLNIEVWKPNNVGIEWHVATVWSLEAGRLAFEAVAPLYSDREVMLRQDCRLVAKREAPE